MNPIILRMKQLEDVKRDYEELLYDAARFVNPRREHMRDSQRFDLKGQRRGKDIYDGTPASALGVWRDGMQGFMVSRSLRWFKSELSDPALNEIDEVRQWLQDYDEAMYAAYSRSNFYSVMNEWFNDAGSVGTATLYTEEDIAGGTTVHIPIHLREVFIAEDRYQQVDLLFRKFFLTARQALQKFGEANLSGQVIVNAANHPEKPHEFIHAVFPNKERQFGSLASTNKRYKSVYLETRQSQGGSNQPNQTSESIIARVQENDGIVSQGGYDIFPYAVWRFRKNSDEVYGYSPAMDFMVAIYGLNVFGKTLQQAAHLSVRPAMNVPEHMRGNVRLEPSGFNYYKMGSADRVEPINPKINYPIGAEERKELRAIIEDGYRVEFFKAFIGRQGEATATEIMEIKAEQAQLMGPQVDRLTEDGLAKNFDIVAGIEEKAGRLPPPPQILVDRVEEERQSGLIRTKITPRFTGPLAQAQRRLFTLQPIKNGMRELAEASVLFPNIIDRVDEDLLSEAILDSSDFPQKLMRGTSEVRKIREARQQAMAQQQAMEQAGAMADAMPKLGKKVDATSPLAQFTGAT